MPALSAIPLGTDVATRVGRIALTGQNASITTTNIYTPPANGEYFITIYQECTTAGAAGTIQTTIGWTDDNGAQTATPAAALALTATGNNTAVYFIRALSSAAITYATTLAGGSGSPVYALYITVERFA